MSSAVRVLPPRTTRRALTCAGPVWNAPLPAGTVTPTTVGMRLQIGANVPSPAACGWEALTRASTIVHLRSQRTSMSNDSDRPSGASDACTDTISTVNSVRWPAAGCAPPTTSKPTIAAPASLRDVRLFLTADPSSLLDRTFTRYYRPSALPDCGGGAIGAR